MPVHPQPRLGRHFAPDDRDQKHILRNLVGTPPKRVSKRWTRLSPILDQGQTGTCVGHAWEYHLLTAPIIQKKPGDKPTAFDIYDAAILLDEFPENDHDTARQMGTSVRGGAKALQQMGLIGSYGWEFDAEGVADWVGGIDAQGRFTGGSLVLGISFYDSMEAVDAEGFMRIEATAKVIGGHALDCDELNLERGFFGGPNSWGYAHFGYRSRPGARPNGRWKMDFETLDRLIKEDGEAAAALELRRAKTA